MKPKLQIAQIITPNEKNKWFLLETTVTTDGFRTRVCDGRWDTLRKVQEEKTRREELMK